MTNLFVTFCCAGEKLNAVTTLLEAFGNCRTAINTNATRFTKLFSIELDHSGQIISASVQVCPQYAISVLCTCVN